MKLLGLDKFRYFLTYRQVRTQIFFSPRGWDTNSKVKYSRNKEYFGVFRSWALPLDFVYDGADLLRKVYYGGSVESLVQIEVEELNEATMQYEIGFVGDIDFSGKQDDGVVFSVTLMEKGPGSKIQAYDDVKYELPLTGPDVVDMILPGVAFSETANLIILGSIEQNFNSMPGIQVVNPIGSDVLTVQSTEERDSITYNPSDNQWFLKVNVDQSVNFSGRIKGTAYTRPLQGSANFEIALRDQDGALVRLIGTVSSPATVGSTAFDFPIEFGGIMDAGTYVSLVVRALPGSDNDDYCMIEEGTLDVSFSRVSEPSNCKGLKSIDLFKRIMAKVAPGYAADSLLLTVGRWKDLIFTCGDAVREIDSAKIKISLSDFYKTMNGIDDAALGIENEITRIENGYYFARNAKICSVGVVASCILAPATEYMFSKIKIGYKDGNTDDLNGKEEYNSGQEWQSPITRVQTDRDWTSVARADQFGIEKIRTEYNIKRTTKGTYDTGSDNDVFMVDCYFDGTVYRPILGSSYDSVTGLSSPETAYNLDLSPKANLLRKGSYLAGVFNNMQNLYINFASATKNAELAVTKDGVIVKQNTDIAISGLPAPYFLPEIAKINCKLPVNARNMFASTPFGFIEFVFKDVTMYGYILDAQIDIARNSEQEFQLLLTPNTYLPAYVNKVKSIGNQQSGNVPSGGNVQFTDSPFLEYLNISIDGGPASALNTNQYTYDASYEIIPSEAIESSFGLTQFLFEGDIYYGNKDTGTLFVDKDHPLFGKTPIDININFATQAVNLTIGEFNNSILNPLTTFNGPFNGVRLQDTSTVEYAYAGNPYQTLFGAYTVYGDYFALFVFSTDRNFTADILVNGNPFAVESEYLSSSDCYAAVCYLPKADYTPAEITVDITITD